MPTGHGEKRGGEGTGLQGFRGCCYIAHQGTQAGRARGLPRSPRVSESEPGWDPDVLVPCRPRAVVAQAWCSAQGHANENALQLISVLESHTSKKLTAKTQEGGRAGLSDSLEMTSSYRRQTLGHPQPCLPPPPTPRFLTVP